MRLIPGAVGRKSQTDSSNNKVDSAAVCFRQLIWVQRFYPVKWRKDNSVVHNYKLFSESGELLHATHRNFLDEITAQWPFIVVFSNNKILYLGLLWWHSKLVLCPRDQHFIWALGWVLESWLLIQLPVLGLGKQKRRALVLGPLHQWRRSRRYLSFWLWISSAPTVVAS